MGSYSLFRLVAFFGVLGLGVAAGGQTPVSVCGAPPIAPPNSQPNIFNEQQEGWLGDAMADMVEREYKPARDAAQSAYLQAIVDKLASKLPPTTIKFRVLVVDSAEINGYSLAGGYIYITRKLAAIARNDDELAAVLGHEMGHIATHQFAFETTRDLKRLLGVTSVGDRADVYAKFQKLWDARYADKHPASTGNSDEGQDEADKLGVYVVAAAGYRPQASSEFWDRVFFVEGKTGNRLSDFFGITKPNQKRLRGMQKLAEALPPGCGGTSSVVSAGFEAWHNAVVANQGAASVPHLAAVSEVKLTPPLRMDLDRLRFSPDGKMILAQDAGSVFALSREPFAVKFRFDAENASAAQFSPGSDKIVFATPGMHTEEWSVAAQKLIAAHEPISKQPCEEAKLSPDGRTVLCVSYDNEVAKFDLTLLDTATGDVVLQKKGIYQTYYFYAFLMLSGHSQDATGEMMPASFSPDGNFALIGVGGGKVAIDLRTRTLVKLGDDLKDDLVLGDYAFISNDRVAGAGNREEQGVSGIYSFPEGKQLDKKKINLSDMEAVSNADGRPLVLTKDVKNFEVGIADLNSSKYVFASKMRSLDAYGSAVVAENTDGSVLLMHVDNGTISDVQHVTLPVSPLGTPRSWAVSPDGKYLALSARARGGIWNVKTGEREFLVRGFSNAVWDGNGNLYAEFPKANKVERHVSVLSMATHGATDLTYKVDDKTHMEYGRLVEWKDQPHKPSQLIMHNTADASVKWTKSFEDGGVKYTGSSDGKFLLFIYGIQQSGAKKKLKEDAALAGEAAAIKNKDGARLIEIVDGETGLTASHTVLELPLNYNGGAGLDTAGKLLYVRGLDNRTMVYSIESGKLLRSLFGYVVDIDPGTGRVCTSNRRDEAVVYDAEGKELAHFHSGDPLRVAQLLAGGTQLMLLTSDQTVRIVDVAKGDAGTAVAAN